MWRGRGKLKKQEKKNPQHPIILAALERAGHLALSSKSDRPNICRRSWPLPTKGWTFAQAYLGHFGVPASVALLHLSQNVNVKQAFHLVPVLEWVPLRALLFLQLGWLAWRKDQGGEDFKKEEEDKNVRLNPKVFKAGLPNLGNF